MDEVVAEPGVRYYDSSGDCSFVVVALRDDGHAGVQMPDGEPARYRLIGDTFIDTDVRRSHATSAGDVPSIYHACPPTEHDFDGMDPISEDITNYTESCNRCGISYGVLTEHTDQDPDDSVEWVCELCNTTYPGPERNYEAVGAPWPICSTCWHEECDPASEHHLDVFPHALLICESGCSNDQYNMTVQVPECGWIGRMTTEMTTRFLGDPPSPHESEDDIETDNCPACDNSGIRVAWPMPRWVKYLAIGRGMPPERELVTEDLFDNGEKYRTISADERAAIREGKAINTYQSRTSSSRPIRERVPFGSLYQDDLTIHDMIHNRLPDSISYNWPHAPLAAGYDEYNERSQKKEEEPATQYLVIETDDGTVPPDSICDMLADEGYHPLDGTHPLSPHEDGWPVPALFNDVTDFPQGMFVFSRHGDL